MYCAIMCFLGHTKKPAVLIGREVLSLDRSVKCIGSCPPNSTKTAQTMKKEEILTMETLQSSSSHCQTAKKTTHKIIVNSFALCVCD